MTTIDDLMAEHSMIAVGMVPLNPDVLDFKDAEGKIILYVQDSVDDGRLLFLSISLYGELSRTYEVKWEDWAPTVTKMMGDVVMHNHDDPFAQLLKEGN